MSNTPSTLKKSDTAGAFMVHETDESFDCRAATLQGFKAEGGRKAPMLSLTFNNSMGLGLSIHRSLQFVQHSLVMGPEQKRFDVQLDGADSIVVGLKALFKQTQLGWSDSEVSKPVISEAMQGALLEQCSDFIGHAGNAPAPDEF